jgi:hypothetical protein
MAMRKILGLPFNLSPSYVKRLISQGKPDKSVIEKIYVPMLTKNVGLVHTRFTFDVEFKGSMISLNKIKKIEPYNYGQQHIFGGWNGEEIDPDITKNITFTSDVASKLVIHSPDSDAKIGLLNADMHGFVKGCDAELRINDFIKNAEKKRVKKFIKQSIKKSTVDTTVIDITFKTFDVDFPEPNPHSLEYHLPMYIYLTDNLITMIDGYNGKLVKKNILSG